MPPCMTHISLSGLAPVCDRCPVIGMGCVKFGGIPTQIHLPRCSGKKKNVAWQTMPHYCVTQMIRPACCGVIICNASCHKQGSSEPASHKAHHILQQQLMKFINSQQRPPWAPQKLVELTERHTHIKQSNKHVWVQLECVAIIGEDPGYEGCTASFVPLLSLGHREWSTIPTCFPRVRPPLPAFFLAA